MLALLWLLACGSAGDGSCKVDDLDEGATEAEIDGTMWSSHAEWLLAGTSLQVNAEQSGGWWYSMVAQTTRDGDLAGDAIADGAVPAEVTLHSGEDGGWVVLYPDSGASYTTKSAPGGRLFLVEASDIVGGCFDFEAANQDGDPVKVTAGRFRAEASDL